MGYSILDCDDVSGTVKFEIEHADGILVDTISIADCDDAAAILAKVESRVDAVCDEVKERKNRNIVPDEIKAMATATKAAKAKAIEDAKPEPEAEPI